MVDAFPSELATLCAALEQTLVTRDFASFYRTFRQTSLPFLPIALRTEPRALFGRAAEVVRRLGELSPAVALAVENHYYVLSAIATLPAAPGDLLHRRRARLLEQVESHRWLVANTNSRVHGDQIAKTGTLARTREGGYEISGQAFYMSLASEGDLLVFVTFLDTGQPAIFACPRTENPTIEIGPLLFADAMRDSDTRRVVFRDLVVGDEALLVSGREHPDMLSIITFQLSWHQALLAALSLGTAGRALEEGRRFLRTVAGSDGAPLAELEGMAVEMGRQLLGYQTVRGCIEQAGLALARLAAQPLEPRLLGDAFELACAAKHCATGCAEGIVGVVRRIIGARSFAGGHAMERLSKEVVFAQLGGEVHAAIERQAGGRLLGEASFLSPAPRPKTSRSLASLRARAWARKGDLEKKHLEKNL